MHDSIDITLKSLMTRCLQLCASLRTQAQLKPQNALSLCACIRHPAVSVMPSKPVRCHSTYTLYVLATQLLSQIAPVQSTADVSISELAHARGLSLRLI